MTESNVVAKENEMSISTEKPKGNEYLIYIVQLGKNVVKIGFTKEDYRPKRLSNMKMDNGGGMNSLLYAKKFIASSKKSAKAKELQLHKKFMSLHIEGEKYDYSTDNEIGQFIQDNIAGLTEDDRLRIITHNVKNIKVDKRHPVPEGIVRVYECFAAIKGWVLDELNNLKANKGQLAFQVIVTPEMAFEWLRKNYGNRSLNNNLKKYIEDMKNGNFVLTTDAIGFYSDGTLFNGQHRLMACVLSGKSFPAIISFNHPEESFKHTDKGRKRTDRDTVSAMGLESSGVGVSGLNYMITVEGKQLSDTERYEFYSEYLNYTERFGDIIRSRSKLRKNNIIAALAKAYIFYEGNKEAQAAIIKIAEILNSGKNKDDKYMRVIDLRNILLEAQYMNSRKGGTERNGLKTNYLKIVNVIEHIVNDKPIINIVALKEDPYKLLK